MMTIGALLHETRKKKNLSLQEVSDQIKIRITYLEALENSNYELIASPVYIKGFLNNYSKFLDIDPNKALALYRREREEKQKDTIKDATRPIKKPMFVITPSKVLVVVVGTLLLALFSYFFYQYQQFATPPFLDIQSPKNDSETTADFVVIEGSTETGSIVSINDQAISTDDLGNFKVTVSLKPGSNEIFIASENGIGKKSTENISIFSNVAGVVIADNPKDVVAGEDTDTPADEPVEDKVYDGLEMELRIGPNSSWVLIETDGEVAFTGVLVPDTVKSLKATDKIYVKTGNAGSTQINLNGQNQGSIGEEGEVESREYTLSNVQSAPENE